MRMNTDASPSSWRRRFYRYEYATEYERENIDDDEITQYACGMTMMGLFSSHRLRYVQQSNEFNNGVSIILCMKLSLMCSIVRWGLTSLFSVREPDYFHCIWPASATRCRLSDSSGTLLLVCSLLVGNQSCRVVTLPVLTMLLRLYC
jgi:hypothetical protein